MSKNIVKITNSYIQKKTRIGADEIARYLWPICIRKCKKASLSIEDSEDFAVIFILKMLKKKLKEGRHFKTKKELDTFFAISAVRDAIKFSNKNKEQQKRLKEYLKTQKLYSNRRLLNITFPDFPESPLDIITSRLTDRQFNTLAKRLKGLKYGEITKVIDSSGFEVYPPNVNALKQAKSEAKRLIESGRFRNTNRNISLEEIQQRTVEILQNVLEGNKVIDAFVQFFPRFQIDEKKSIIEIVHFSLQQAIQSNYYLIRFLANPTYICLPLNLAQVFSFIYPRTNTVNDWKEVQSSLEYALEKNPRLVYEDFMNFDMVISMILEIEGINRRKAINDFFDHVQTLIKQHSNLYVLPTDKQENVIVGQFDKDSVMTKSLQQDYQYMTYAVENEEYQVNHFKSFDMAFTHFQPHNYHIWRSDRFLYERDMEDYLLQSKKRWLA